MSIVENLYQAKKIKTEKQVEKRRKKKKQQEENPQTPHTQIFFKTHMESLKLHLYQINLGGPSVIKHVERAPIKS